MLKKTAIIWLCLLGLTACGSTPTQTVQTEHLNFAIPSYRQNINTSERQDTRADNTWSILIEYTTITNGADFQDFVQWNIDTLKQNLGLQIQEDIVYTNINMPCSGDSITGAMISFTIDQDKDVLYLSQIFTIHTTDITVISVASFAEDTRSETANIIGDTITCAS